MHLFRNFKKFLHAHPHLLICAFVCLSVCLPTFRKICRLNRSCSEAFRWLHLLTLLFLYKILSLLLLHPLVGFNIKLLFVYSYLAYNFGVVVIFWHCSFEKFIACKISPARRYDFFRVIYVCKYIYFFSEILMHPCYCCSNVGLIARISAHLLSGAVPKTTIINDAISTTGCWAVICTYVWYGADFWLLRIFIFALSQRIHKFSAIIVKCAFYYCCYLYLVVRQIVRAKFISVSQSNYGALSR